MTFQQWFSIGAIVLIGAAIILTGMRKRPGVGIIIAVLILAISFGFNWLKSSDLGFTSPKNLTFTLVWGLGLGILLALISSLIIDPASEKLVNEPVDLKMFEKIRGNWKWFLLMLIAGGIAAPFLEEVIFRGFLLSSLAGMIGKSGPLVTISLLISSIIFGLAHWYQGKSGAISTTILGMLLGDIFIWSGYNLWLPILTHGIINIIGLILIFINQDFLLKKALWKEKE